MFIFNVLPGIYSAPGLSNLKKPERSHILFPHGRIPLFGFVPSNEQAADPFPEHETPVRRRGLDFQLRPGNVTQIKHI
jgi:hypothetical protein